MVKLNGLSELETAQIYIYGAGMVAELLIDEVRTYSNIGIKALVVSQYPANLDPVKKVPVISVKEVDKKIPVIIATLSDSHIAIAETLRENGIYDLYAVSETMFQQMRKHFVPIQHDIASLKIRLNEMKGLAHPEKNGVLFVTDTEIRLPYTENLIISTATFMKINAPVYKTVYIFLIDWNSDWRAFMNHALEICENIVISYRYKYLKDKQFSLICEAKEKGFMLSGQKKIYRSRRDYYTEDTLLYFQKRDRQSLHSDMLCFGCGICSMICPTDAIAMLKDNNGYDKPFCDMEKCINCGKCFDICPVYAKKSQFEAKTPECYTFMADDIVRKHSSSGGVFPLLAKIFLRRNGYVCGAAWKDDFTVEHLIIDKEEDLRKLQKSKYLRSDIHSVVPKLKKLLEEGKEVLFVGCPCQVDALKKYLGKGYINLTAVDLICAQAPSGEIFRDYLEQNFDTDAISECDFRDKDRGWRPDSFSVRDKSGRKRLYGFEDRYQKAYHGRMMMPLSCEHCAFLTIPRPGDLTIGDAWGITDYEPGLDDGKGTSTIIVNSERGKHLYSMIAPDGIKACQTPFSWTFSNRTIDCITPHPYRDRFYTEYREFGFNKAVDDVDTGMYDVGLVGNWSYPNYGSELTYYALYSTLKALGYSVLMIEWAEDCPWHTYGATQLFENEPYGWYEIAKPVKNHSEFYALNEKCRMFVQGSDQLLHPYLYEMYGGNVMLDWVDCDKKKISYAMSFGHENVEYKEADKRNIAFQLALFDDVSVREDSAVDLMKQLFDIQSEQVLDPVFLQEPKFYESIAEKYIAPDDCLFCYILDPTEGTINILRKFADKNKLKLRVVSDAAYHVDGFAMDGIETGLSEEQWIAGFINSRFVVVDSFHGMCVAIICKKNFAAICNEKRGAARFHSILKLLGLENRMVTNIEQLNEKDILAESIAYEKVHRILAKEKEKSLRWLCNALERGHRKRVSDEYVYMMDRYRELEKRVYEEF